MKIPRIVAGGLAALLVGAGLATLPVEKTEAHTPVITSTCNTIVANLDSYEFKAGSPAIVEIKEVTPAIPGTPDIYGEAPLLTPATVGTPAVLEFEYSHTDNGNGNSNKLRWEAEGWNAGENGKGWVPTGNSRELTPAVAPTLAVYGEKPLLTKGTPGIPAVTESVTVKAEVPAQDNTITYIIDGVTTDVIHFGTSYKGVKDLDGTKNHTYKVIIDAIGTAYDKTFTGKTTACPVPIIEIPYPHMIGAVECGPKNDKGSVDLEWTAKWGPFVGGPWIDGKYKDVNGKWVIDGSAQIKSEFRATYIWEGTSTLTKSDFRRWMMYPGTTPFIHEDVDTECPVIVPEKPVDVVTVVVTTTEDCDTDLATETTTITTIGSELIDNVWVETVPVVVVTTATRPLTDAEQKDCPVVTPPVVDPPVVITPPTVPVAVTPPVVAVPVDVTVPATVLKAAPTSGVLAYTGFEGAPLVLSGILAVLLGAILLIVRKRRELAKVEQN